MTARTGTRTKAAKARRGDLIVVHRRLTTGYWSWDTYSIGLVTSTSWTGRIKTWAEAGAPALSLLPDLTVVSVIPQDSVDVDAVLAVAAEHTFPGADIARPYPSRAEVDALISEHRRHPRDAMVDVILRTPESKAALADLYARLGMTGR